MLVAAVLDIHFLTVHLELGAYLRHFGCCRQSELVVVVTAVEEDVAVVERFELVHLAVVEQYVRQLGIVGLVLHIDLHEVVRRRAVLSHHVQRVVVLMIRLDGHDMGRHGLEAVVRSVVYICPYLLVNR